MLESLDGLSLDLHLDVNLNWMNRSFKFEFEFDLGFALGFWNLICAWNLNSRDMQLMYFATNLTCRIWMQVKIQRQKFAGQNSKIEVCRADWLTGKAWSLPRPLWGFGENNFCALGKIDQPDSNLNANLQTWTGLTGQFDGPLAS